MELARVFLPDDSFETIAYSGRPVAHLLGTDSYFVNEKGSNDREEMEGSFMSFCQALQECGLHGALLPESGLLNLLWIYAEKALLIR